jgi:hypothetical protein
MPVMIFEREFLHVVFAILRSCCGSGVTVIAVLLSAAAWLLASSCRRPVLVPVELPGMSGKGQPPKIFDNIGRDQPFRRNNGCDSSRALQSSGLVWRRGSVGERKARV